jgi:hypothetical protein
MGPRKSRNGDCSPKKLKFSAFGGEEYGEPFGMMKVVFIDAIDIRHAV